MLMDLVSDYHSDKLSDAGEKKVCMECFLILSFTSGSTKTIFKVIDRFFNVDSDFVGFIPFSRTAFDARICAEIFLWIDVNHPSAGRSRAGVVTVADAAFGFIRFIVFPFHFWAYKFHGRDFAF